SFYCGMDTKHFVLCGCLLPVSQGAQLKSQFYIVQGTIYTPGRLDTLEMSVNVPIKNKIIRI
ncbi:MAG: hypothetical protein WAP53_06490, partial [Dysgonamonadaceae bacterium]